MRRAPITITSAAVLVMLAVPVARAEPSRLIQAAAGFQRVGAFWVSDNPTFRGAIDAYGGPTSCHILNSNPANVVANWAVLGLRINLVTFGGLPSGATGCTAPDSIQVSTIRITGKQWFTSLKLRVGSPVAALKRSYPRAIPTKGVPGWYGAGYWLVTRRAACLGDCGKTTTVTAPVLVAETLGSRVTALILVMGAQGE
jgi:hypothetical protein